MRTGVLFSMIVIILLISTSYGQQAGNLKNDTYFEKTVIFKVKPEYSSLCSPGKIMDKKWSGYFGSLAITSFKKMFPSASTPKTKYNNRGEKLVDLSLIYEIEYSSSAPVDKIVNYLRSLPYIQYAQPKYREQLLYNPSDPQLGSLWHLPKIKALEAWDVCKGDSNVVIGISDTGNDNDHEDLRDNLYYNYSDPINGIDDDSDGFTDNFWGWDMAENDSDPQVEADLLIDDHTRNHGIYVAGLAAASTDNGIGIAGTGFRCRYFPVKILNSGGVIVGGYESIIYAADHGANIVNCSWGGNTGHPLGQDIINYATFNKNVLVVAAAGNDNNDCLFYPASYDNVFSVAGTQQDDKLHGSNYGIEVDITGPATNLPTTINDGYGMVYSGTSFSSPIVAGCAAIVKSYFPSYTALQIGERLRVTADNIDTIPANASFRELLGGGRVNLYRALTDSPVPSVKMKSYFFADGNDNVFRTGDTITLSGTFVNYLAPATNLIVNLTTDCPDVEIISSLKNAGALGTYDSVSISPDPFVFRILPGASYDEKIDLKLVFLDSSQNYRGRQYVRIMANPTYLDIDTNLITTTVSGSGRIGFVQLCPLCGNGFTYNNGESLLFEAGLLVGKDTARVSNCVRGSDHFSLVSPPERIFPAAVSDFDSKTTFSDDSAYLAKLNMDVMLETFAWNNPGNDKYIIFKYNIINKSILPATGIYAGLFADWDIINYAHNRAVYDAQRRLSYTFCTDTSLYTGIQLLSPGTAISYCFDNVPGGSGGVDISNGFSLPEKFYCMTHPRENAGVSGAGADVCNMISAGPYTIAAGDTAIAAFALLAGDNLSDLIISSGAASAKYDSIVGNSINGISSELSERVMVYPNPAQSFFSILIESPSSGDAIITMTDATGRAVSSSQINLQKGITSADIDTGDISEGLYFLWVKTSSSVYYEKILLVK